MNLPTLYRSLPHPAQAKSLVAEASSLSISALADLCEEHNLTTESAYFRSCSLLLAQFEDIASRGWMFQFNNIFSVHYSKRTINFPSLTLPYPTLCQIYFVVRFNTRVHIELHVGTPGDEIMTKSFYPEKLSFRDFPQHRLRVARQVLENLAALDVALELQSAVVQRLVDKSTTHEIQQSSLFD